MSRALQFLVLLCFTSVGNSSRAADIVTGSEITALLTGNTILGTWNGDEYKQYFRKDGSTIYAPKRSQSTLGKWRVNSENNTYESWWEQSGWSAYRIIRQDRNFFWTTLDGKNPEPFEILPGEQLVWKQN